MNLNTHKEKKITPFVKWLGGKTQLLAILEQMMPSEYNRYYEPFIGGGAMFLDLQPENAVINDTNAQLLNVYRQIRDNIEQFMLAINELDTTPCDKNLYYSMREEYNQNIIAGILNARQAALMIWLNKRCFNGLYRVNSKGLFNASYINDNKQPARSIEKTNIININQYLNQSNVIIRESDFENAVSDAARNDFVYFDSPYIPISQTESFTKYTKNNFNLDDHKRLARLCDELSERGVKIMLSNNDVPLVHELYASYNIINVDVKRNINSNASKRTGKEVIITNY